MFRREALTVGSQVRRPQWAALQVPERGFAEMTKMVF